MFPNDEVRQVGFSLLSEYQNGLFPEIEKILLPIHGNDWFQKCLSEEKWKGKTPTKDLYTLLKEIFDYNNQNFRMAFAMSIFSRHSLDKVEVEELGKIFKYRNKWAHDQSDIESQVNLKDLRALASLVKKYTISESTKLSCEEILTSKSPLELMFSIPAVARNLPENARTADQMLKISSLLNNFEKSQDGDASRIAELHDGLKTALHAWTRTSFRLEVLLLQHRTLQAQIMGKILVDANSLRDKFANESHGHFEFNDKSTELELMREISKLSENLKLFVVPLVEQMEKQVDEILKTHEDLSKLTGVGNCVCEYCVIDPHGFGPFQESDVEIKQFLEEEVFNHAFGVRFIKVFATEDFEE